jgi:hypothetical protein
MSQNRQRRLYTNILREGFDDGYKQNGMPFNFLSMIKKILLY